MTCSDCKDIPAVSHASEIFEENPPYQLMHNGVKILKGSYHGDWMTQVIHCLKGHHDPQEERVFYEVLEHMPAGATIIEAGSYWGYYSAWLHHEVREATNILVEPNWN